MNKILENSYKDALGLGDTTKIKDSEIRSRIEYVVNCPNNRSVARFLLACSLAKATNITIDIRKPYTEIGDEDSYSGRNFDETYLPELITTYSLPCNSTTAFLTPAFRNISETLTSSMRFSGKPEKAYKSVVEILESIQSGKVSADDVLIETIRMLIKLRDARATRFGLLMDSLSKSIQSNTLSLSSEDIVNLLEQHVKSKNSSRLPVLIVAAIYETLASMIGEKPIPLNKHNAADSQTGSLGDVEIYVNSENGIGTVFEMKDKRVTKEDINIAISKLSSNGKRVDNYIFITTDEIEYPVLEYARSMYEKTNGIEFMILDAIGFARHFMHMFHRSRMLFLDNYQRFLIDEPTSAVSQELKEVFIVLRTNAQASSG